MIGSPPLDPGGEKAIDACVLPGVAAPMVGGVVTSFVLELLIYPVIFTIWKWHREVKPARARNVG